MTDEQIKAIEARHFAASRVYLPPSCGVVRVCLTDIPALLAEVRRLRLELAFRPADTREIVAA